LRNQPPAFHTLSVAILALPFQNLNVSKQRPSEAFWRRRLFKNTFTRRGRLRTVSGWSVKIQHRGIRRTISLRSRNRKAAALEARTLHQTIISKGWEAALAADVATTHELPPGDPRYWRPRLVQRKRPGSARENAIAARIEHEGTSYYFPLGAADESAAAASAAEIYRTVTGRGWGVACNRFTRELTLGFHWATNPIAWTYTTLYTEVGDKTSWTKRPQGRAPKQIALVEADDGLGRALAEYLSRYASVHLCSSAKQALREIPRQRIDLVLANHVLTDMPLAEFTQALERFLSRLPFVVFSTYEDSNQLFLCVPGGANAYLLKRTPPDRLLEPIETLLQARKPELSRESISEQVRQYFYGASLSLQSAEDHPWLTLLTPREKQILDCLSKGYVDKEIADELGISGWTVHGHVKNIFEKLNVHSRTAAVVKYLHK
jgi:DNA-binding NarL/FixJ family response regulator